MESFKDQNITKKSIGIVFGTPTFHAMHIITAKVVLLSLSLSLLSNMFVHAPRLQRPGSLLKESRYRHHGPSLPSSLPNML